MFVTLISSLRPKSTCSTADLSSFLRHLQGPRNSTCSQTSYNLSSSPQPSPPIIGVSANGTSIHLIVQAAYLLSPPNRAFPNSHSFTLLNRISSIFLSLSKCKLQIPLCSTLADFHGSPMPLSVTFHSSHSDLVKPVRSAPPCL